MTLNYSIHRLGLCPSQFSFGMRGHLIENGRGGRPIGEMNVSGDFVSLFQNLTQIGNDPWPYSSHQIPSLTFRDVQFSGA